jgi:Tol biopolymer transport system component
MAFNIFAHTGFLVASTTLDGLEQKELLSYPAGQWPPSAPAWSPDGNIIVTAYRVEPGHANTLLGVNIANRKEQRILASDQMAFIGTNWLPDQRGLVVLYKEKRTANTQIGFVSYPQGKLQPVTKDTNNYFGLSVSKDGKTIATVLEEQIFRLYLVPAAQMNEEAESSITFRGLAHGFAWHGEDGLVLVDGSGKIFQMNDRGEQKTVLVDASRYGAGAIPCPKGRYFIVSGADPNSSSRDLSLWRLDTVSADVLKLTTDTSSSAPVCSPDGKWVYYVQMSEKPPKIKKVSIDGGPSSTIAEMGSLLLDLDVSSDGKLLAFLAPDAIGVIDVEAGTIKKKYPKDPRLGSSTGSTGPLKFTPEGNALAYVAHVSGVDNIWAQPIDGRSPYPLTHFKSDWIPYFDWSPSGKRVGIVRGRTDSNVVLIREANP